MSDAESYFDYTDVEEWYAGNAEENPTLEYLVAEVVRLKERISRLEGR